MDNLNEQILRAKELMGILSEQQIAWNKPGQNREELEKCFTEIVRKGNEGLYLEQVTQPCWDNVVIPMVTSGEELDFSGKNENRTKFVTHCQSGDRYKVIRLLTYMPELQSCLQEK